MNSGIPENSFYNQFTLSVSNDDSNHAILTWVSSYSSSTFEHLMYSLLDEQGNTVTPPVRFYQASLIDVMTPWIIFPLVASPNGYGNASFSQPVSGSAVDLFVSSQSIMLVNSGETVLVPIEIKNQGLSGATGVEFTVELDKELTYISDTSGMTPKISGRTLTWQVQNLDYLGRGSFDILLATTPSALGTSFPVSINYFRQ